jgi:hypothetical protein
MASNTPTSHGDGNLRRRLRALRAHSVREDGQALVEFSLVLLPVLVILLGIAYFGIAINDWLDETQIAGSGARYASVNQNCITAGSPTNCGTPEVPQFLAWLKKQGDNLQVKNATATICSPTSRIGDYVEVKLSYNYNWVPILKVGASTPVTSTARMRLEAEPSSPYPTSC